MIDHLLKASFFLFLTASLPVISQAFEHWHIANESELKAVLVSNRSSDEQVLWISGPIKSLSSDPENKLEESVIIPAYSSVEIPLIDYKRYPWIHFKTEQSKTLLMSVFSKFQQHINLASGSSNRWTSRGSEGEILIANLAPFSQKVSVFADSDSLQITLEAFEKRRIPVPRWAYGRSILVEGEARIHAFLIGENRSQAFSPSLAATKLSPDLAKTYFRMSNKDLSQSYVVGLTDPKMIRQAREQIQQPIDQGPWIPRILVAEIDFGSQQENRDFSKPGAPLWSWGIKRVFNFAQLAHQDCDGSPEMIEELLNPWKEFGGVICFWNYRVVEEISASTVAQGSKHPAPESLQPSP